MKKIIYILIASCFSLNLNAQGKYTDEQIGFNESKLQNKLIERGISQNQIPEIIAQQRLFYNEEYKSKIISRSENKSNLMCTGLIDSDRQVLIDIYNATNGANWKLPRWNLNLSPCEWEGVFIENDRVVRLELSFNNLVGSIPSSIGDLSNLEVLNLGSNDLVGSIPSSICDLSNLEVLALSFNELTGEIPPSIGRLTKLTKLFLSRNELEGTIPSSLGNLTLLTRLNMDANNLSGNIPSSFSNLINLKYFSIGLNDISGVIPSFTNNNFEGVLMRINKFIFSDIEPNHNVFLNSTNVYDYFPQQNIDEIEVINVNEGDPVILTNSLNSPNNSYKWYKDLDFTNPVGTSHDFEITNATLSDAGRYDLRVTNSIIDDLTLFRNYIAVRVNPKQPDDCVSELTFDNCVTPELTDNRSVANTCDWDYFAASRFNNLPRVTRFVHITTPPSESVVALDGIRTNVELESFSKEITGLTPGKTVQVKFYQSNSTVYNPDFDNIELRWKVKLGNSIKYSSNMVVQETPTWTENTLVFVPNSTTERLSFVPDKSDSTPTDYKYMYISVDNNITVTKVDCDEEPPSNCDDCYSFKPIPGDNYVLSAWVKENVQQQVRTYVNSSIKVNFLDGNGNSASNIDLTPSGRIIDEWQRIYKEFTIPSNTDSIEILLNNNSETDAYFDDIRIHPFNGNMKSFVYDPITQRLMAELDENNYSTFYEYDNEGGLVRVKKETEKGVYTIQETRSKTSTDDD